jgi:hypothetical protein
MAKSSSEKSETSGLNLQIPLPLRDRFKAAAAREKRSMSDQILYLMEQWLDGRLAPHSDGDSAVLRDLQEKVGYLLRREAVKEGDVIKRPGSRGAAKPG